jgi:hypothetical protein
MLILRSQSHVSRSHGKYINTAYYYYHFVNHMLDHFIYTPHVLAGGTHAFVQTRDVHSIRSVLNSGF